MKNYHIEYTANYADIHNNDEDPIVKQVEFWVTWLDFDNPNDGFQWSTKITFLKEIIDMPEEIQSIPDLTIELTEEGCTSLSIFYQLNMNNIIQLFSEIQKYDPLPLNAFIEIKEEINFDLKEFIKFGEAVEKGNHSEALKIALQENDSGDYTALPALANVYQNKGDLANYYKVLSSTPKSHPEFKEINSNILDYLMTLPIPDNSDERTELHTKKFRAAYNAKLVTTDNLLDQLTGNKGHNPEIRDVVEDPVGALIKAAAIIKSQDAIINSQKKALQELKEKHNPDQPIKQMCFF